ncbi:serine protease [Streptomyces sp. NPDC046324]|uniref:trypsin-like serine peptidase n=1 Tax=Streptomyces sp. NPDC046324 TaxID=3154915 RepID=UPI0033CA8FEB
MRTLYGSPVATDPARVFEDLRRVAARVRRHLEEEISGPVAELPGDETPAGQISRFAQEERARVLEAGVSGLEKLAADRADEISEDEHFGMEAIVLLEGRPAIPVQGRDFAAQDGVWSVLEADRAAIRASIARVGRLEVTGHPSLDWVGTAFLVGPRTVMTTRHVAGEFSGAEDAGLSFREGMSARVDLGEGYEVTEVIGIHPDVDMALLRVVPPDGGALPTPLAVAADAPADLPGRPVYMIGHPVWDGRRDEPESMRRIFMDVYDAKRLQPGTATEFTPDRLVMRHDCSTLGDSGGSPVFDLADHRVLGLQFGGRYGSGNEAVPLWELVDDPLLERAEVNWV